MKTYLVGGAVRDELLGVPFHEKDWVVVGATVEEMLAKGFRPVGKDFPVFLHPETAEEYALARTERKVGKGYTGFTFNASPEVTLEEDLQRRDLTINAMAKTPDGQIIDPFHGKEDIQNRLLRHVSAAFIEDPVRILRVARFVARYADLGFKIAAETTELMKQMVKLGEVDALVAERVWKEWERALAEKQPNLFFATLASCGAEAVLFPQISYPGPGAVALEKAATVSEDTQVRFAVLLHVISKEELQELSTRYRLPSDYKDLALLVIKHQDAYCQANLLNPEAVLDLLQATDAFRRKDRFEKFLLACEISFNDKSNATWLKKCFQAATTVDIKNVVNEGCAGPEIAKRIKQLRVEAIQKLKSGVA